MPVCTRDDIQGELMDAVMAARYEGQVMAFIDDEGTYGEGT